MARGDTTPSHHTQEVVCREAGPALTAWAGVPAPWQGASGVNWGRGLSGQREDEPLAGPGRN